MTEESSLSQALRRIFRPLARLAIAKGLSFQMVQMLLKQAFVESAERDFKLDGKRLTDSRISMLTGLQRRDIKEIQNLASPPDQRSKPFEKLHSQLLARPQSSLSLAEFDDIARALYQDIHPRTFLDEFLRLGLLEQDQNQLQLTTKSMIPEDQAEKTTIFADNLTAHAQSAVSNLLGAPPQLEQAVYATGLTASDAEALQNIARQKAQDILLALNEEALLRQSKNKGDIAVRIGLYYNAEQRD